MSVIHRARVSQWPAMPMSEAYETVSREVERLDKQTVAVWMVRPGDVLAEDVVSAFNIPERHASIMDGYAVVASDPPGPRKVIGSSTAGDDVGRKMKAGECIRVTTGAAIPDGADAVVKVEDTKLLEHDGNEELVVEIQTQAKPGLAIRQPGSDTAKGDLLLAEGAEIASAELGILLGSGLETVSIFKRPRCAVMSTGNELVEATARSAPLGHARDTNRPQILAICQQHHAETIDMGIACDEPAMLVKTMTAALRVSDILISSGGVSMGEKDLLKSVLQEEFKFKIHFGRVWMKPGLPATFATGMFEGKKKIVFAVPGNPVSAWVCTKLFAAPAIKKMRGLKTMWHTKVTVQLRDTVNLDLRPEFRRAYLEGTGDNGLPLAVTTGNQISSRLLSVMGASLLLELPGKSDEVPTLEKGTKVNALIVGNL